MTDELRALLSYRPEHLAWPVREDTLEILGYGDAIPWLTERKRRIEESERDPLRCGYEPGIWQVVRWHMSDLREKFPQGVIKLIIWGGNRSSKTRFAANYVNRDCKENLSRRWWCCDSTEAMARTNQMRLMYEQFPPEWRHLDRDEVTDVRYTDRKSVVE